jgi:hypothetical protein
MQDRYSPAAYQTRVDSPCGAFIVRAAARIVGIRRKWGWRPPRRTGLRALRGYFVLELPDVLQAS